MVCWVSRGKKNIFKQSSSWYLATKPAEHQLSQAGKPEETSQDQHTRLGWFKFFFFFLNRWRTSVFQLWPVYSILFHQESLSHMQTCEEARQKSINMKVFEKPSKEQVTVKKKAALFQQTFVWGGVEVFPL